MILYINQLQVWIPPPPTETQIESLTTAYNSFINATEPVVPTGLRETPEYNTYLSEKQRIMLLQEKVLWDAGTTKITTLTTELTAEIAKANNTAGLLASLKQKQAALEALILEEPQETWDKARYDAWDKAYYEIPKSKLKIATIIKDEYDADKTNTDKIKRLMDAINAIATEWDVDYRLADSYEGFGVTSVDRTWEIVSANYNLATYSIPIIRKFSSGFTVPSTAPANESDLQKAARRLKTILDTNRAVIRGSTSVAFEIVWRRLIRDPNQQGIDTTPYRELVKTDDLVSIIRRTKLARLSLSGYNISPNAGGFDAYNRFNNSVEGIIQTLVEKKVDVEIAKLNIESDENLKQLNFSTGFSAIAELNRLKTFSTTATINTKIETAITNSKTLFDNINTLHKKIDDLKLTMSISDVEEIQRIITILDTEVKKHTAETDSALSKLQTEANELIVKASTKKRELNIQKKTFELQIAIKSQNASDITTFTAELGVLLTNDPTSTDVNLQNAITKASALLATLQTN